MAEETHQPVKLILPRWSAPCLCGSGRKFRDCCHTRLPGFDLGEAWREPAKNKEWGKALAHLRADVTQYTIWHNTNTAPNIHRMRSGPFDLVQIDVDALAGYVDRLARCYLQLERHEVLPAVLERLRTNIDDPRWHKWITYEQALCRNLKGDTSGARADLARLGPIEATETDADILTLHLELNGEGLGLFERMSLYDRILANSEEVADQIHYRAARAFELLLAGDAAAAEKEFEATIAWAIGIEAERPLDSHESIWLCKALEGLAVIRRDKDLFSQTASRLTALLTLRNEWSPAGRHMLYHALGDAFRYAREWESGAQAYLEGEKWDDADLLKVFRSECLLMLRKYGEARSLIASVDLSRLDEHGKTDHAFAYAYVAAATRNLDDLARAETLLIECKTPKPYFDRLRLYHLAGVNKVRASVLAGKPATKPSRLLNLIGSFSRYVMLQPNIGGIGVNLNAAIDDGINAARKPKAKK